MAKYARPMESEDWLFESMLEGRHIHLAGYGKFHVVAGPGESLPELAEGDLLVRREGAGTRPRMAPIASAPATAHDFFLEGVIAEHGPSHGLFVEVAGPGPRIARRIGDSSGRLAEHTMVIRPSAFEDEAGEDFAEVSDSELQKKRSALVAAITKQDLYWHTIPLADGYKIRVTSPIMKDDLFIPVMAKEALQLARQFEVFPLSRAVMDQTHNYATKVEKPQSPGSLYDFVTYSERLRATPYYREFGYSLASGAHKLWVASARAAVVNYGFYIKRVRGELVRCGPHLDKQLNVIQGLGARHNALHWDYSQLLQFMSGLEDPAGQRMDLRQALMDKLPAVWDELPPPHPGSLP